MFYLLLWSQRRQIPLTSSFLFLPLFCPLSLSQLSDVLCSLFLSFPHLFFLSVEKGRCGSMWSWRPGTPSGWGARAASSLILLPEPGPFSAPVFSFPRCGPGPPPLPPWGAAEATTHLESFSSTSPPFLFMWFRIFPISRRYIFGLTSLCCVCSWFFLNARTFGDVLSHEPVNFIDSLDPSSPSPPEYYKVLSSVCKMSLDISICFIYEKGETQSLRTSPLWQIHALKTRRTANFLPSSLKTCPLAPLMPRHFRLYFNKNTQWNPRTHCKTWLVRL